MIMSDTSQCVGIINTLMHAWNVRQEKKRMMNVPCKEQAVCWILVPFLWQWNYWISMQTI